MAKHPEFPNWRVVNELGEGGQGKVFKVITKTLLSDEELKKFRRLLQLVITDSPRTGLAHETLGTLAMFVAGKLKVEFFAAKKFHAAGDDSGATMDRVRNEMNAMQLASHPNLLRILDCGNDWFVCEYFPNGTLEQMPKIWLGDLLGALKTLKPIADAMSHLHQNSIVHRDIKPQNIFVRSDSSLCLGDFGLVYFYDDKRDRFSQTLEKVGTRDWMPTWAEHKRLEEIPPSFDVFSLAKVLWHMVSGKERLKFWYFKEDEFNLVKQFPDLPEMHLANELFEKCITERPDQVTIQNASVLATEFSKMIGQITISRLAQTVQPQDVQRTCSVCGGKGYIDESTGPIRSQPRCKNCIGGLELTPFGKSMVSFQKAIGKIAKSVSD